MYKVRCVFVINGKVFKIECSKEYEGITNAIKRGKKLMSDYENSEFFVFEKSTDKVVKHFKKNVHKWRSIL
jgi:hypothetical protein